jgi:hypothetical protein
VNPFQKRSTGIGNWWIFFFLPVYFFMCPDLILAHGGKNHGNNDFTALNALQEGVALYEKLLVSGKLDETWETGLSQVAIIVQDRSGRTEYRVSFTRSGGDPSTVYIFFSQDGRYTGSNFDGK